MVGDPIILIHVPRQHGCSPRHLVQNPFADHRVRMPSVLSAQKSMAMTGYDWSLWIKTLMGNTCYLEIVSLFIIINHDFFWQSLKPQLSWALKYLTDKQTWDFATGQYNWCETIHKQAIEPAQCHVVAKQQWIFWVRKLIRCGEWLALAFN